MKLVGLCFALMVGCLIGATGVAMWHLTHWGLENGTASLAGALVIDATGFAIVGTLLTWLFDEVLD